jgi:cytochrome c peroxidase
MSENTRGLVAALSVAVGVVGCGDWRSDVDGFTERDLALLQGMVLSQSPTPAGNAYLGNAKVRDLGQQLFFTAGFAARADGTVVTCASCHAPEHWFSDPRARRNVSWGLGFTRRNTPSLVNVIFYEVFAWDGRTDSLQGQCAVAYQSAAVMAGTRERAAAFIRSNYAAEYREVFGSEPLLESDDAVYEKLVRAWATYLAALTSRNSPFDRFASGAVPDALDAAQKRGLKLFLGKAGCIQCHRGPMFSDFEFHNVGIGQTGDDVAASDPGRFEGLGVLKNLPLSLRAPNPDGGAPDAVPEPTEGDKHRFRTKSLRQVAETGPYFHAGQAETLKDVVWFYAQGGDRQNANLSPFVVPLGLTDEEQADLVSFLESLTGDPVPAALRCDSSKDQVFLFRQAEPAFFTADGGITGMDGGARWVPYSAAGSVSVAVLGDGGTRAEWYDAWKAEFERCDGGRP